MPQQLSLWDRRPPPPDVWDQLEDPHRLFVIEVLTRLLVAAVRASAPAPTEVRDE